MENPNFYERFWHFTNAGWDKEAAERLANSTISTDDFEAQSEYISDVQDRLEDLESRGFYYDTDDPMLIEQIERGDLQVIRVVNGATAKNAIANASANAIIIKNENHYLSTYEDGAASVGPFAAKFPGVIGNGLLVSMADGDGSSAYYKDVINNRSKFIWWMDHPDGMTNWGNAALNTAFTNLDDDVTVTLSKGVSADTPADANIIAGLSLFTNDEQYDLSLLPLGKASQAVVDYAISSVAEVRRDCIVFFSPELADVLDNVGQEATDVTAFRDTLPSSSYAVMDSGWKYQYDRYNDKNRWIPLNGDTAGCAVRTDFVADPWFSPAGFNRGQIKNIVKLAFSPTKTDRDNLYKKGVNPIVSFPGNGTVLYGDKTLLAKPSAFDRINVRRLFIVLEKAIATAAKYQLFEFNDAFTRAQFRGLVEPYLRDIQGRRGIIDFKVVCDESNNTPQVIDTNNFVADIYVKPSKSINFIQLNFIATRTGISFEEVGA